MFGMFKKKSRDEEISELKNALYTVRNQKDSLEISYKTLKETNQILQERIDSLNEELSTAKADLEALQKSESKPVKYADARKTLTKSKLAELRKQLEAVPNDADGFGGSAMVYDKKTKRVTKVSFKTKQEALDLLKKAEKGNVELVF